MRKWGMLALVGAATMLPAGLAEGHTKRWDSRVKLNYVGAFKRGDVSAFKRGAIGATGKVKSKNDKCENDRQVFVEEVVPGPNLLAGSGFTSNGTFVISIDDAEGTYQALVFRDKLMAPLGHKHVCDFDKSEDFEYHP